MFLAAATVLIASLAATGVVLYFLRRHAILDHPNARSSHAAPVPRGGGLAVIAILVCAWAFVAPTAMQLEIWVVLLAAALLAAVSWIDDLGSLSPVTRLLAQGAGVAPPLIWLADSGLVFQGLLPQPLDLAATALAWLWFINLFNFMDGIDAISAVEATSIGGGVALIASLAPASGLDPALGLTLAAAAIGFGVWNWPPAKIFLGDVGSVPLGFLLGWLLLKLAASGYWAPALILPLYYLADATITLARRAARGERIWQAHRQHYYQRAVQRGRSHGRVSTAIGVANLLLAALAVLSLTQPWIALGLGALVTACLLVWLSR
jgi:UDP-N-acetylmuramyl pentapeptide phosphotransferase/UDP-N-acetylglucosamine-1-phosphate transferase